ncbi:M48 family metallopeptidase [Pseudidiomarina gelatinasegens]|uniref:M48 family metallopeptidase n=1 Tax=Pseudidiomarina gelatinasegens TaxID=2487740 RepID=UPI003A975E6B
MAHPGFFQHQANARRNTLWLVLLFASAVVLITLSVCLVGYLVTRSESSHLSFPDWLLSSHGLIPAVAVVLLIGVGSLVRWIDLAGGGSRVARMVGARAVDPATTDRDERKLRNIVEEMAIASGVPVPDLYIMDRETGINAFVAGYTPGEAVMVVTHGAITQLTRDELQGVVGHEFSHILNGDMRLNVRLIALLAGILMLGQIGGFLLQSSAHSPRSSRNNRNQGALILIGLALLVIGYVGVFFGRLIQAAVSRQREVLADASSVQFTRNPEGIGSALFKIGLKGGYLDTTSHASDMNHMCFGESARMKFSSLLASHPPIEERINRIQPGLGARLRSRLRDTTPAADLRGAGNGGRGANDGMKGSMKGSDAARVKDLVAEFTAPVARRARQHTSPIAAPVELTAASAAVPFSTTVGTVNRQSEAFAASLLKRLPATFRDLLYTRAGAVQLCYALLIHELAPAKQDSRLWTMAEPPLLAPRRDLLDKLIPALNQLGPAVRLPALELAMPALRKLDPEESSQLLAQVQRLARADQRMSLFELAVISFLQQHLALDAPRASAVRHQSYRTVMPALELLFSLMARAGSHSPELADTLYGEAMAGFASGSHPLQMPRKVTLPQLQRALADLRALSPLLKPAVIDACGHCVLHDGKVEVREYELMRLVADQLDCPMPPMHSAA